MKKLSLIFLLLAINSVSAKETVNPNNFICIHRESGLTECKNLKPNVDTVLKSTKIYKYKDQEGQVLLTNIKK